MTTTRTLLAALFSASILSACAAATPTSDAPSTPPASEESPTSSGEPGVISEDASTSSAPEQLTAQQVADLAAPGNVLHGFTPYKSAAGNYSIMMPVTPTEREQETAGLTLHTSMAEVGDSVYVAGWYDHATAPADSKQYIDDTIAGVLEGVPATKLAEKDVKLEGKYPGRWVEATMTELHATMRMIYYVVDTRTYTLQVANVPADKAEAFFATFKRGK